MPTPDAYDSACLGELTQRLMVRANEALLAGLLRSRKRMPTTPSGTGGDCLETKPRARTTGRYPALPDDTTKLSFPRR